MRDTYFWRWVQFDDLRDDLLKTRGYAAGQLIYFRKRPVLCFICERDQYVYMPPYFAICPTCKYSLRTGGNIMGLLLRAMLGAFKKKRVKYVQQAKRWKRKGLDGAR